MVGSRVKSCVYACVCIHRHPCTFVSRGSGNGPNSGIYRGGGKEKREKRHGEFIRIRRDSELNISKGRGVDDPRPRRLRRNHGANIAAAKKKKGKKVKRKKKTLSRKRHLTGSPCNYY